MYLHSDKDLFTEVITEANAQTGIAESIIEKDYYVTMILKLLAKSKTKRFSRHLYDLHMLYPTITIDNSFMDLIQQVRDHRSQLPICPSAKEVVDIKSLIMEFLDKEFYKSDYNNITRTLISDDVTYEQTSLTLREIADKLF